MIAMRRKLRFPAETAAATAAVSAHRVAPNATFSMLQPMKTEPSELSTAEPLLNREYGEYELAMAIAAFSMRFLSVIVILPSLK